MNLMLTAVAFWLACWFSTSTAMAARFEVDTSGSQVSRDKTEVILRFSISDVESGDLDPTDQSRDSLLNHFDVILPADDSSRSIADTRGDASDTTINRFFYWDRAVADAQIEPVLDRYKLTFLITIRANDAVANAKLLSDVVSNNEVEVALRYRRFVEGVYQADREAVTSKISLLLANPDEAPGTPGPVGIYKGVFVTWHKADAVAYTDGQTRSPSATLVMAFRDGLGVQTGLSARQIDRGDNEADPVSTTCRFDPNAGEDCLSCPTDAYLVNESVAGSVHSQVFSGQSGSIIDLESGESYTVVVQYLDGLKRSACVKAEASTNFTLTEQNGAPEAEAGQPRCFVATSAFGPHHDVVKTFTWFRGYVLNRTEAGRALVQVYYEYGPILAQAMDQYPILKSAVRGLLWPLAGVVSGLQWLLEMSGWLVALALVVVSLATTWFWRWCFSRRVA